MKKAVLGMVAGAALVVAGMAQAESSVTLYGVGDAWVGSKPTKGNGDLSVERTATDLRFRLKKTNEVVVDSGGLSGSRLGVLVKEDLGSGLAAFANFEGGVSLDGSNSAFMRKSVIGLGSASWGKVTLGRQYTAYDDVFGMVSAQGNDSFDAAAGSSGVYQSMTDLEPSYQTAVTAAAARFGVTLSTDKRDEAAKRLAAAAIGSGRVGAWVGYQDRYNNSIRYDSPNFSGFSGAIAVGVGENKTSTRGASNNVSLHLKYANGPLMLALAHQMDETGMTNAVTGGAGSLQNTLIGGSYDFGILKAHLAFNSVSGDTGDKAKEWLLGASAPIAGKYKLVGQLASSKLDIGMRLVSFGLEGHYSLSKRTTAYAALNHTRTEYLDEETKANTLGAGMRHRF